MLAQADVLGARGTVLSKDLHLPQAQPVDQAAALAQDLRNTVIITLGAEGAIGARGDKVLPVEALPVRAADTTGAGD